MTSRRGLPQCKDIPDDFFMRAVEFAQTRRDNPARWGMKWDVSYYLTTYGRPVFGAFYVDGMFPENLLLAKARQLIKKGKIDGCACGCRGDFVIKETR